MERERPEVPSFSVAFGGETAVTIRTLNHTLDHTLHVNINRQARTTPNLLPQKCSFVVSLINGRLPCTDG
ncbi:MAG: hypothetical protein IAF02_28505 [Anaerolineae bacterium]|nr:hypothetical protein [Anaerolineae bacterium]